MWFLITYGVVMAIVSCTVVNKRSYRKLLKCKVSSVSFYSIDGCTERESYLIYVPSQASFGWKLRTGLLNWRNVDWIFYVWNSPNVLKTRPPTSFLKCRCDQKLMYDLEWPILARLYYVYVHKWTLRLCAVMLTVL